MVSRRVTETVSISDLVAQGVQPERGERRVVVLVVDDEQPVADAIAEILQKSGFCAMISYGVDTAIDVASVVPPDVMILDILLPGMSGVDLAMIMKKQYPGCRMLLTADPATGDLVSKARSQGHDFPVLMKPLYPRDLLFAIADVEAASRIQHCNS